eukprot:5205685-Amphidinium_carterae.1
MGLSCIEASAAQSIAASPSKQVPGRLASTMSRKPTQHRLRRKVVIHQELHVHAHVLAPCFEDKQDNAAIKPF